MTAPNGFPQSPAQGPNQGTQPGQQPAQPAYQQPPQPQPVQVQQVPQSEQPNPQISRPPQPAQQPPAQQVPQGFGQPVFGYGQQPVQQPGVQQFQQPQPQQPTAVQQQMQPGGFNPAQVIVAAPGVPPELVGRTMGEAFTYYSRLRDAYIAAQSPQQPTQQQPTQQQRPASVNFWSDPEAAIGRIVEQRMAQATLPQAMAATRSQMAQELPGYQQLQPQIDAQLSMLPAEQQANPEAHRLAYKLVVGDMAMKGQPLPSRQQQQQPNSVPQQLPVTVVPTAQAPAQQFPSPAFMQPTGQMWQPAFTEQPGVGVPGGQLGLTAEQMSSADKMGISHAQYAQAMRGIFS